VRIRSEQWSRWMSNDPRFAKLLVVPASPVPRRANGVRADVFLKTA
jgi:hypothetical protein